MSWELRVFWALDAHSDIDLRSLGIMPQSGHAEHRVDDYIDLGSPEFG